MFSTLNLYRQVVFSCLVIFTFPSFAVADTTVPSGTVDQSLVQFYFIGGGSTSAGCGCTLPAEITDITGTAHDSGSGVRTVTVQLVDSTRGLYWNGFHWVDGPVWVPVRLDVETWILPKVDLTYEGRYLVRLTIRDKAGNVSSARDNPIASIVTLNDIIGPTANLLNPEPYRILETDGSILNTQAAVGARTLTLSGSVLDIGLGVEKLLVRVLRIDDGLFWNGTSWQNTSVWVDANVFSSLNAWELMVDLGEPGLYRIHLNVRDFAGNITQASQNPVTDILAIADDLPPFGSLRSPAAAVIYQPDGTTIYPDNEVNARIYNIVGFADDDTSEVVRVNVQIEANQRFSSSTEIQYWNGFVWQEEPTWLRAELYLPFGRLQWRVLGVDFTEPGIYRIRMNIRDAKGNVARASDNPIVDIRAVK